MDDIDIAAFCRLFQGRMDAYGTEQGGCKRTPNHAWPGYYEQITEHLLGNDPLGVYPMVPDPKQGWVTRWGCVDFDLGDDISWAHATNLHRTLEAFGVQSFRERSRSKGFHVWIFSEDWVHVSLMRRALIGASSIAGSPITEVNPKSEGFYTINGDGLESLKTDSLGNYVRLPYPNGWTKNNRRVMLDDNQNEIGFHQFVAQAWESRCTPHKLMLMQELYVDPKPEPSKLGSLSLDAASIDFDALPAMDLMCRKSKRVFVEGPLDGGDRSNTLWKLASNLMTDGYTPEQTLVFMVDADRRWGKFMARNDQAMLEKIVSKVFA